MTTIVNLSALEAILGGYGPVDSGFVSAQYWAGGRAYVSVVGDEVRLPSEIRVAIVDGETVPLALEPTDGKCCVRWEVRDIRTRHRLIRYTDIPDVAEVDFGDLTDVDPSTFEPSAEGQAAWDAAVAAAQAAVTGAQSARDVAVASAADAVDAAAAAVPAASEAVAAASTATIAAGEASTAAGDAVSASDAAVAARVAAEAAAAEAVAVPVTNDGIMAVVLADPDSASSQQLVAPRPGDAFGIGVKYGVNPAGYAPSTNLNGQPLSTGAGNVTVQSANGTTVFGVLPAGDALGVLSGSSSPTVVTYNPGPVRGGQPYRRLARMVVKSLAAIGSANGFGVVSGAVLTGGALSWFRTNIASATRFYLLQKGTGTTLTNLSSSTSTIGTSNVVAQVGDVVDLEVQTGYARLIVNGVVILEQPLDATEQETYRAGDLAGVWCQPSNYPAGAIGSFGFVDITTTGETTRTPLSVDVASFHLPPQVQLDSEQISQARDAVVPGRRDIRQFGAKVDGQVISVGTTAGSSTVTPVGYKFKTTDVGKAIAVRGAGPIVANANDGVWLGTITAVNAGIGTATMTGSATSTQVGVECAFGTADDEAVSRAGQECWLNGGGEVYFPPGITIVTKPYRVRNFVCFAGEDRDRSKIHVLMNTVGGGNWLYVTGVNEANPITGVKLRRFTVNAWAMFNTGTWTATIKPLNLFHVKNCSVTDIAIIDSPATAIPFDHSVESCVIAHNLIIRPGRLAPVGVGPGGSGIGMGTTGTGDADPTLVFGNSIIGSTSAAAAGVGNNGIFVEAQSGASPDTGTVGYRIIGNYIEGMPVGFSDQGSTGTIFAMNVVRRCSIGARIKESDLGNSSPGRYTHIDGNQFIECTGPGTTDGVGILISTVGDNPVTTAKVYTKVTGNSIFGAKSEGIIVEAEFAHIAGTQILNNDIRDCGLSALKVRGSKEHRHMSIVHNQMSSNGRRAVAGDQAAVLAVTGSKLVGGRIQDNDWYDLETVPTQTAGLVQTGATLTSVIVDGNTA